MASGYSRQDSLNRLTEFAPLTSEIKQSQGFFSRLFKRNVEEGKEVLEVSGSRGDAASQSEASPERQRSRSSESPKLSTGSSSPKLQHIPSDNGPFLMVQPGDVSTYDLSDSTGSMHMPVTTAVSLNENHTRTLTSVLKHLGNILDRRSQTPQAYKDSDFKQYWMPDSNCKECYECGDKFNAFRRRHHCRICGQIFCSRCCNQEVPGRIMGYTGFLRVCRYCCCVVLSYAQNQELSSVSLREDLSSLTTNDSDPNLYQDITGRLTPTPRKRTRISFMEEEPHGQRSSNSPDASPVSRKSSFFDMRSSSDYIPSVAQEWKILTQDSAQLRDLWRLIQHPVDGIEMQSHRHRIRTYHSCIVGNELVDWLISRDKAASREQAVAIGQALLDAQWLECVTSAEQVFCDEYALYRAGEATTRDSPMRVSSAADMRLLDDNQEPLWLREIKPLDESDDSVSVDVGEAAGEETSRSVFYLDSTEGGNTAAKRPATLATSSSTEKVLETGEIQDSAISAVSEDLWRGVFSANNRLQRLDSPLPDGWRSTEQLSEENGEKLAYERLSKAHKEHLTSLTEHLLNAEGLTHKWTDIILSVIRKITLIVRPDVSEDNDDMDIRQYVQIKKIPGGHKSNTGIVCGVVCTKNVANKKMAQEIMTPRILLLSSAIEYQRVENKFSSLEPQILQENEFLKNCVARIAAVKPDIVLVEKSVSRVAQDFLLDAGITLVLNVKPSVMERVARFTQAEIVSSDGGLVNRTHILGFCHTFRLQTFQLPAGKNKTLMFFDGCASHLGCTVTLRGGPVTELKKVKKIIQFMTYVAYNSKLETSFIMDSFAMPPPAPDEVVLGIDGLNSHEGSPVDDPAIADEFGSLPATQNEEQPQPEIVIAGLTTGKKGSQNSMECSHGNTVSMETNDLIITDSKEVIKSSIEDSKNKVIEDRVITSDTVSTDAVPASCHSDHRNCDNASKQVCVITATDGDSSMHSEKSKVTDGNNHSGDGKKTKYSCSSTSVDEKATKCQKKSDVESNDAVTMETSANVTDSSNGDKDVRTSDVVTLRAKNNDVSKMSDITASDIKKSNHSGRDSKSTEVLDFSDPLHNYQKSKDDSIFQSKVQFKEVVRKHSHKFRKALDDVILSSSPYMKYHVPYLETDTGTNCALREYFPEEIYWSRHLDEGNRRRLGKFSNSDDFSLKNTKKWISDITKCPPHKFVLESFTINLTDNKTLALLADFRARGGQLKRNNLTNQINHSVSSKQSEHAEENESNNTYNRQSQWSRKIDCLDPFHHQRIAVLFSTFSYASVNIPVPCVIPWVVNMEFYGRNDITLGGFLERYCFRETYKCPSIECDTEMVHHIRRFVHESGSLQIVLKLLDTSMPSFNNSILMWGWCRKCKQVTPVVPMSRDTWNMSFGKYLELRFHGDCYGRRCSKEPCSHNFSHDHYQYFGFGRIVASFKYSRITLREIALPPPLISVNDPENFFSSLKGETQIVTHKGVGIYSHVLEHLHRLAREAQTDTHTVTLKDYITQLQAEKDGFRKCMDHLLNQLLEVASGEEEENYTDVAAAGLYAIQDSLTNTKRKLADGVQLWNARIQEIMHQQKKFERNRSPSIYLKSRDSSGNIIDTFQHGSDPTMIPKVHVTDEPDGPVADEDKASLTIGQQEEEHAHFDAQGKSETSSCSSSSGQSFLTMAIPVISSECSSVLAVPGSHTSTPMSSSPVDGDRCEDAEGSPRSAHTDPEKGHNRTRSSEDTDFKGHNRNKSLEDAKKKIRLASYDEVDSGRKSSATMKNIFTSLISGSGINPVQMPFGADEHYLLPPSEKIPVIIYDNEPSSIIAYALSSPEYEIELQDLKLQMTKEPCQVSSPSIRRSMSRTSEGMLAESDSSASLTEQGTSDSRKRSSGRVLSFFRGTGGNITQKEKTSNQVSSSLNEVDSVKYTPYSDRDSMEDETEDDFASFFTGSDSEKNKSGKPLFNYHIELQFSDHTANFYCRVYFAEQFRKLRKLIFTPGENRYIRSLSRCFTWLARGGKSGSAFCKTQDDRFILKQMSRLEVQSFVEFAPFYFQHITKARSEQKPTVLAKILGVYRIGYKNSQTNTALRQDLLVMENLFYNRKISQIFDLKGSVRNRLVNTAEKTEEDVVLQDENLLKLSVDSPLYIRPHSKTALTLAITNDTQFLSSQLVMDYSLLVGLDDQKKELVIGIIDYIRTFTWDKKLEMVVKSTYNQVSGQGKMPTVVSPEIYRTRFLEAMNSYFLLVPDRWAGLGFNVDC